MLPNKIKKGYKMELTQNRIARVLEAIDETTAMLNKELAYMPKHQKTEEIISLRSHIAMLNKMLEDNAAETWLAPAT